MEWTPEQVQRLIQLYNEGKYPAEIGRVFELPRNAITGKLTRLLDARVIQKRVRKANSMSFKPVKEKEAQPKASPLKPGERTLPLLPSEIAALNTATKKELVNIHRERL